MLVMFEKLFQRANKCPIACLLKVLLGVIFIYTGHIAISHQLNVSHYSFVFLLALVAVIATLAVATHSSCRLRNMNNCNDE
jgi:hypothetical protein